MEYGKVRISVALAAYNGKRYIREQMDSILCNLKEADEVWVSDDGSFDGTWEILQDYVSRDSRVHVIHGPKAGVIANVEYALKHCRGRYIYLADQDDVWMENKVRRVQQVFEETGTHLIVHDCEVRNGDCSEALMPSFAAYRGGKPGFLRNLSKNTYIGCCMAFSAELLPYIFPIPKDIQMHDQWIGIINDLQFRDTVFLPDKLLWYRRHEKNVSDFSRNSLPKMVKNRVIFLKSILRRSR